MGGQVDVATPDPSEVAAVRAVAPLAADLMIECGWMLVPAGALAMTPTLEQERSEAAQVLHQFLRDDPWRGMGSVSPGGWMLLARDADTIVVGQRHGTIGLGSVVRLERRGGRFTAVTMQGWGLRAGGADEAPIGLFGGQVRGRTVTAGWWCAQLAPGIPSHAHTRTVLAEGPDEVHVLLVGEPSAEARERPLPFDYPFMAMSATFELSAELGERPLLSNASIPATPVPITTVGAESGRASP